MAYSVGEKNDVLIMLDRGYSMKEVEARTGVPPRTQRRWKRAAHWMDEGGPPAGRETTLNHLVDVDQLVDNLSEHPELTTVEGQRALIRYAMGVILQAATLGALSGELPVAEVRKLMGAMTRWHREVKRAEGEIAGGEFKPVFEAVLESARAAEAREAASPPASEADLMAREEAEAERAMRKRKRALREGGQDPATPIPGAELRDGRVHIGERCMIVPGVEEEDPEIVLLDGRIYVGEDHWFNASPLWIEEIERMTAATNGEPVTS